MRMNLVGGLLGKTLRRSFREKHIYTKMWERVSKTKDHVACLSQRYGSKVCFGYVS